MIRQSRDKKELQKHPYSRTLRPECQAHELQEEDDLDPADFYDAEDLRP